jgi:enterochelin esterase-like enzyme
MEKGRGRLGTAKRHVIVWALLALAFSVVLAVHFRLESSGPSVQHVTFVSRYMGQRSWGFNIFLPPRYTTMTNRRFPVVYFCHGYGDDENTWVQRGLPLRLQAAMIAERSPNMIMVFVNGGKESGFNNLGPSDMVESYVVKELIPYIDSHYRTIPNRSGRAIEGFSMGGYAALKFAYKYPQLFSDVVAYSAAPWFSNCPDNNLDDLARNHVSELKKEIKIRMVVGLDGDLTLDAVRQQHALLNSLSIPNDYEEVPDVGHSLLGLYDADNGGVGIRGLDFHADCLYAKRDRS